MYKGICVWQKPALCTFLSETVHVILRKNLLFTILNSCFGNFVNIGKNSFPFFRECPIGWFWYQPSLSLGPSQRLPINNSTSIDAWPNPRFTPQSPYQNHYRGRCLRKNLWSRPEHSLYLRLGWPKWIQTGEFYKFSKLWSIDYFSYKIPIFIRAWHKIKVLAHSNPSGSK